VPPAFFGRRRYPRIVDAALKNRHKQFVIDGEAVVLGVDGIVDFNALHSRKHDHEVRLYAFDILALDGEDLRELPLSTRKANLARLLARRTDGIFVADFERRDWAGPVPARLLDGPGGHGLEARGPALPCGTIKGLGQGEEPHTPRDGAGDAFVLTRPADCYSRDRLVE
jgi:ATP dependent DNA ligase domain